MPWHCLGLFIGILYWAVFGLCLTLAGSLLFWILPAKTGRRLGKIILHYLFRWFLSLVRALGLVHADNSALVPLGHSGPLIIAPNHAALWDAVFVIACLPRVTCVMKPAILENPVLGGGARLAGYIPGQPVTRMIRLATRILASGGQLLFFPEGTRTNARARWINPLRGGCAVIATRSQVPVQTVFIRTSSRFLQKGWSVFRRPHFPIHVRLDLGPLLVPQSGESPQAFTTRLEQVFITQLSRPDPLRRKIVSFNDRSPDLP